MTARQERIDEAIGRVMALGLPPSKTRKLLDLLARAWWKEFFEEREAKRAQENHDRERGQSDVRAISGNRSGSIDIRALVSGEVRTNDETATRA